MTKAPDFLIPPTPVLEECHPSVALATQYMLHLCVARGWMTTLSAAEGSTPRLSRPQTRLAARPPQLSPPLPGLAGGAAAAASAFLASRKSSGVLQLLTAREESLARSRSRSRLRWRPQATADVFSAPEHPEDPREFVARALYPSECVRGGGELAGAGEVTSAG